MKKNDVLIILAVLILALGVYATNQWRNSRFDQRIVEVISHGETIYSEVLTDELSDEIYLETPEGYNRVLIEEGIVRMIEADCRDQVCVLSKAISLPGESIVCLPHEVIVQVVGDLQGDVDVISE